MVASHHKLTQKRSDYTVNQMAGRFFTDKNDPQTARFSQFVAVVRSTNHVRERWLDTRPDILNCFLKETTLMYIDYTSYELPAYVTSFTSAK